ncbi:hypothetical protein ALC57_05963, partial [Trachymyrmex cornetzi]
YTPISYSSTLTDAQLLDLTIPPPLDPGVQEIMDYSPPPIKERFLAISLDQLPTPPPPFDQLPTPPLIHADAQSINWNRMFQLFSSSSTEGDRVITIYVPGNSSPFLVQLKHLVPACSWTTFLATNTE